MPDEHPSVLEVFDLFEDCFLDDPQEKVAAILGQEDSSDEQSFAV